MSAIPGAGFRQLPMVVKTANYTLTLDDMRGGVFTNEGAAGAITFSLPVAKVGQRARFYAAVAQELRLDPNGTETIVLPSTNAQGAAGKYLTANAIGEWVDVECKTAGEWATTGFNGTFTHEA